MKFALGTILLLLILIAAHANTQLKPDVLRQAGDLPQRLANP